MSDTTSTTNTPFQHEVENMEGRIQGRVSWFNSRKGFGFIHVITEDSEYSGQDVYVHFSGILSSSDSHYRKLRDGEFVEFRVEAVEGQEGHTHQAVDVTGPSRYALAFETVQSRPRRHYNHSNDSETTTTRGRGGRSRGGRGRRGRGGRRQRDVQTEQTTE